MGRAKLKIQRLESFSNRQLTFTKRKLGLMKKAEEISILCDIDIILLLFSPSGKPTFFNGGSSKLEEIVSRFSQLSPQERAKRKLEALDALRKSFEKVDHDVDMREFFDTRLPSIQDLCNQLRILQDKTFGVHKRLSWWMNLDKIENMEHLCQMEHLVRETLHKIHQKCFRVDEMQKQNFTNPQVVELNTASQLQAGMQLTQMMPGEIQMPSWDPADECQPKTWDNQPSFPCQRNVECTLDTSINCSDVSEMERERSTENYGKLRNMRHNAIDDKHSIGSLKSQPPEEPEVLSWNTDVTSSDLRTLNSSGDVSLLADQMNFLDSQQMNFLDSGFTYNDGMQHTFNEDTMFNHG